MNLLSPYYKIVILNINAAMIVKKCDICVFKILLLREVINGSKNSGR